MGELGFKRGLDGVDAPVDISGAERRAVSTAPDSALQRAITGKQFMDEGFASPRGLDRGGPKAYERAERMALETSDIQAKRAGEAIALTNAALQARGRQSNIDKAFSEQEGLRDFNEQTRGMSAADAFNVATPDDLGNSAIMESLKGRGTARESEIGLRQLERGERIDVATEGEVFQKEVLDRQTAAMNAQIAAKAAKAALEGGYDKAKFANAFADVNPELSSKLMDRLDQQGPEGDAVREEVNRVLSFMEKMGGLVNEFPDRITGESAATTTALEEVARTGKLSNASMLSMAREAKAAQRVKAQDTLQKEARKETLTRMKALVTLAASLRTDEAKPGAQERALKELIDIRKSIYAQSVADLEIAEKTGVKGDELKPYHENVRRVQKALKESQTDLKELGKTQAKEGDSAGLRIIDALVQETADFLDMEVPEVEKKKEGGSGETDPTLDGSRILNRVKQADGSIATVKTISFSETEGGPEILIPTIINNKEVSEEEAKQHYRDTGEHYGIYPNSDEANAAAESLHDQQAALLDGGQPAGKPAETPVEKEGETPVKRRKGESKENDALFAPLAPIPKK